MKSTPFGVAKPTCGAKSRALRLVPLFVFAASRYTPIAGVPVFLSPNPDQAVFLSREMDWIEWKMEFHHQPSA
jgi:hypothetical protein